MYGSLLFSTDGSEVATKGLDHGLSLAKALNVEVTTITVTEPFYAGAAGAGWSPNSVEMEGYEESQAQSSKNVLSAAKASAEKLGISAEILHVPNSARLKRSSPQQRAATVP